MLQALSLLLPVFAVIAIGRAAVGYGFIGREGVKGLNDFALWLALPALLFRSIATGGSLHVLNVATIYLAGCLLVYIAAGLLARIVLRRGLAEAAVFALNATYGNVIYLGTPVVAAAFGANGVNLILAIIALHSGVLLPLTSILVEFGGQGRDGLGAALGAAIRSVLRNPIVMSIAAGAVVWLSGITLPGAFDGFLRMLGAAAGPLALFCVGASLPGFNRGPVLREAVLVAILKLCVLPAVIGGLALAAGVFGVPLAVAVITASMPTGANAFLLSRKTAGFMAASASVVVITTTVSLATLSMFLSWMR